jgi:hypothetical protein
VIAIAPPAGITRDPVSRLPAGLKGVVGDEQLRFVDVRKHKCATPLSPLFSAENETSADALAEMLPGIGIFGTGSVVRIIVPFLRSKGFVVEALWGRTLPAAQKAAKELGIPFCTTKVDEVLLRKDVDLIFVLCSPHLHAQISVKALGIGKHVLCDRPAGICQNDALKMVKASQYYPSLISIGLLFVYNSENFNYSGVFLSVNHSLRFLPAFTLMRKCLRDNYIGNRIDLCDVKIRISSLIDESEGLLFTILCLIQ